ncbi:phosphate signaling complex protein PhoU [Desulfallas thermosapovorans]|uniref:Phosphate-specific transport system accessory protein PhoU n=1 Tax=Desulfallas thermosapovorans DSM 6562 TaxID=1121431 RepID=A0A5S4ZPB2_9FIRM|nr:phosphate signaling complex protein PhoU [Desulfallas thermosapovorans]TYO94620.1 PhoU-like phosphate uptake regulator [Desulfallas thermosapovorans DSM 6562]
MARESFQEQLSNLRNDILQMGKLVENAIDMAVVALKHQDLDLAEKVVMDDEKIDRLELAIESRCLSLLALQQPMARDLRFIGTALKINTDLERMGDYACNIGKVVLQLGSEPFIKPLVDVPRMAELAMQMVRENLTAYVNQDRNLALKAAMHDHEINILYHKVFNELVELMTRDPGNVKQATYLLFIARYLERIGDHATNLSEWIIYMITGERLELNES